MEDVHGHWVRDRVRKDIEVEVLCSDKQTLANFVYLSLIMLKSLFIVKNSFLEPNLHPLDI